MDSTGPARAQYQADSKSIFLHRWGKGPELMGIALMLASPAGA